LISIGWREYVAIPDWRLRRIRAKIDTGAKSCAMDVHHLEHIDDDRVRFEVALSRTDRSRIRTVEAKLSRSTMVKSSLGDLHERVFVETEIELAGQRLTVEIGLVSRESMITRMLIGRNALEGRFLVDCAQRFLWPPAARS
jgi:hypothetical protein